MSGKYEVTTPGEINDAVRAHLAFLESLSAEQIVGLVDLLYDQLEADVEVEAVLEVLEAYFGNRPKLREEIVALFLADSRPKVRQQVACNLLSVAEFNPLLAESLARQLLADPNSDVQSLTVEVISDDFDEFADYGLSPEFADTIRALVPTFAK